MNLFDPKHASDNRLKIESNLTCFGEGNIVITTSLASVTSNGDSFVRIPLSENNFMALGLLMYMERKVDNKHIFYQLKFSTLNFKRTNYIIVMPGTQSVICIIRRR